MPTSHAATWSRSLVDIVESALEGGTIAAEDLRTIVLAPRIDGLGISVWLGAEWEDYPYINDDDSAAGAISLAPWLDEAMQLADGADVDRPAPTRLVRRALGFHDAARDASWARLWNGLADDLRSAARLAATGGLARFGESGQIVGVFVTLDRDAEGRLVALCHPHGGALVPTMVNRHEDSSLIYPQAALVDDGVVLFFCEGQGDALRGKGNGAIRTWRFDEMLSARVEDDGVSVRLRGDVFEHELEAGHTQEEHGGLTRDEIRALYRAHFQGRAGLWVDFEALAAPADGDALRTLFERFADERARRPLVTALVKRHAPALAALLDSAGLDAKARTLLGRSLVEPLIDAGLNAEALAVIEGLAPADRSARLHAWVLWNLGRIDEIGAVAEKSRLRAIAAARLGDRAAAEALLEQKDPNGDDIAARGIIAAIAGDDAEARTLFERGQARTRLDSELIAVARTLPALAALVDAGAESRAARAAAALACAAAPVVTFDLHAPMRVSAHTPPAGVFVGEARGAELKTDARKAALDAALVQGSLGDARTWAGDGDDTPVRQGALTVLRRSEAFDVVVDGVVVGTWCHEGRHSIMSFAWTGDRQLACATNDTLFFVDLSDPAHPVTRARAAVHDIGGIASAGDLFFIRTDDDLVVLALGGTQASPPRPIARIAQASTAQVTRHGDVVWLFGNEHRVWRLDIDARAGTVRAVERWGALLITTDEDDGKARARAVSTPLAFHVTPDGGELRVFTREAGLVSLPANRFAVGPMRARTEAHEERIVTWLRDELRAALDEGVAVSRVRAGWIGAGLRGVGLELAGPGSVLPLGAYLGETRDTHLELEPQGEQSPRPTDVEGLRRVEVARIEEELAADIKRTVLARALLAAADVLRDARAGDEVILCVSGSPRSALVAFLRHPGGVARPRLETAHRVRSLEERVSSSTWYQERETIVALATRDVDARAELYRVLAAAGPGADAGPLSVVCSLLPIDVTGARDAIIAAATQAPRRFLGGLLSVTEDPRARPLLESLIDDEDDSTAVMSRRGLGRIDEPASVERVRRLLRSAAAEHGDVPRKTLASLSLTSLALLRDELLALWHTQRHDHELLGVLVRAGVDDLPADAWREAKNERSMEGDSMMAGMFGDGEPPVLSALRTLAVRRLLPWLAQADDGSAVFPTGLPPETTHKGWQRFYERAFAALDDDGRGTLIARVVDRARTEGGAAVAMLYHLLITGDARAHDVGAALRTADVPVKDVDNILRLARLSRVQHGWRAMKAGKMIEARAIADAALADAPDGQALFFDARLTWLEHDDPTAALPKIDAAIAVSTDPQGLARLYNLKGAVYDALKRYDECIPWFERALAANPEDAAMLYSNIAEAHEKCGRLAEARAFAERASARGSTTDVVKRLMAG